MKKLSILMSIFLLTSCFSGGNEIERMVKEMEKAVDVSFYKERLENAKTEIERKIEIVKNAKTANFEVCKALQVFEEFKRQWFLSSVWKTEEWKIIYDSSKIEDKIDIRSVRASDSECMVSYYKNGEKIEEKTINFKEINFDFVEDFEKYTQEYKEIYKKIEDKWLKFIQDSVEKIQNTELSVDEIKNILNK